jgi:hypothetical protein
MYNTILQLKKKKKFLNKHLKIYIKKIKNLLFMDFSYVVIKLKLY